MWHTYFMTSKRKRVLYLQTEDRAFLLHRLPMSRAARDAGFDVHVATRVGDRRTEIESEGFTLHHIDWARGSRSPFNLAQAAMQIRRVIHRVAPDILHNVAVKPTLAGSLASLGMKHKVVNNIAGLGSAFLSKSPHKRIMAAGLAQALRLLMNQRRVCTIVQNPDDRVFLLKIGVRPEKIVIIAGSGVDTKALQPLPEPEEPVVATFVGRMLEDKGVRALVEAHGILSKRGTSLKLLLAGTPDPENPTSISESELAIWNSRDGLEWLGHVNDVTALWAKSHIAVLPSRREGLPKSLLEAAALGRPIVASDAPGCREIAVDGMTALTHPIDDAKAIADALQRLRDNADLRKRYGAAARQLVVEHFSNDIIGSQTVELYNQLISSTSDLLARH